MINERERVAQNSKALANSYETDRLQANTNSLNEPTLGELFVLMSEDLSTLFHKEIELVRAEANEKLQQAIGAGISLGLGGILLLLGAGALLAAAILALGPVVGYGLSALIIGAIVLMVGLILVQSGKANLRSLTLIPEKSIRSLKKDTETILENLP